MNAFKEAIEAAILLFPIIALIFTVPYVLYQYHKYGSLNSYRTILIYSFILYLLTAYFLVILPLPSIEFVSTITKPAFNLQPFLFITNIFAKTPFVINDFSTYFPTLKNAVFYEAIFNIFLTIPFGIYLHYYFKCSFPKTLFYTFCLTLFFEVTQLSGLYFIYPRSYRVFDVDDLILNTFGGILGYGLGSIVLKILPTRDEIDTKSYEQGTKVSIIRRWLAIGIDGCLLCLLNFLLGYFIYKYHLSFFLLLCPIFLYFLLVLIFKQSVGMSFMKLTFKGQSQTVTKGQVLLYYFLFILEYGGLFGLLELGSFLLLKKNILSINAFEFISILFLTGQLFILILNLLKRFLHVPVFYERKSKLTIESAILVKEKES